MKPDKRAYLSKSLSRELAECESFDSALLRIQSFLTRNRKDADSVGVKMWGMILLPLQMIEFCHQSLVALADDLVRDGWIPTETRDGMTLDDYLHVRRRQELIRASAKPWADALDRIREGGDYSLLAAVVFPSE